MTAQLIDGKQIAEQCRQQVRQQADAMLQQTGVTPHLAAILCGDDPASQVYVRNKEKACATAGFRSTLHRLPADVTQPQLLQLIAALNSKDCFKDLGRKSQKRLAVRRQQDCTHGFRHKIRAKPVSPNISSHIASRDFGWTSQRHRAEYFQPDRI